MHAVNTMPCFSMISNTDLNYYYENNVKMSRENTKESIAIVMPVINQVLKRINQQDKRFSGQPACTGSYYQGLKVNRADEFDINIPIQGVDDMAWGQREKMHFEVFNSKIRSTNVPYPPPSLGYCSVRFSNPSLPIWMDKVMRYDDMLVPFLVRQNFKELFQRARAQTDVEGKVTGRSRMKRVNV